MRRTPVVLAALALASILALSGCYRPGGPVPESAGPGAPRAWTEAQVDAAVAVDEAVISAPLPDEWGAPEECDEIRFLRFRPSDGSTLDPADPSKVDAGATDAMLVMLPGILEGANGFEYLARQMVFVSKARDGLDIEVWAVERRNNRLEDLSAANSIERQLAAGAITAEEAARMAVDYYYRGGELNGRTFDGWLTDPRVPFLSEFGLRLDTEDVFTVIRRMVPDRASRRSKVFVGGHSMGGFMTTMFAGWDLDGDAATLDDAGWNNCAGLFGLDTTVSRAGGFTELFLGSLPESVRGLVGEEVLPEPAYASLLHSLRTDPHSNRILPFPMINAESMGLLELLAMMARFAPDEECTVLGEVPFSGSVHTLLRFMFSRDLATFMDGTPQLGDFRLTNEAMLGVIFDDSFAPVGMIQNSMGFLGGGSVVKKEFPMSEAVGGVPVLGRVLGGFMGTGDYYIPNDAGPSVFQLGKGPLYHWVHFDEVGDDSDPSFEDTTGRVTYTTAANEVSDIRDVARVIYRGPANLTEWYFSTRLLADLAVAPTPYGPRYGLNFLHTGRLADLPKIEFVAEQGVMGEPFGTEPPPPETTRIHLEGYNHMDVLTASANTPSRRENGVIGPFLDFIAENLYP